MVRKGHIRAFLIFVIAVGALQYITKLREIASTVPKEIAATPGFLTDSLSRKSDPKYTSRKELGPIFYNVYIPEDDTEKQENALRIINEQMQQRGVSDPHSKVLYILIGSPNITDDFCQPNCHRQNYFKTGGEVNTLQSLYEYCQENPKKLVTYLHDKGSFHHTEHNEVTRRTATKAALDCRSEMAKHPDFSPFNVCTGLLVILPQYLSNANMWTAKCSYIRNLLPPKDYETAMQRMYNETLLHPVLGATKYACLKPIHWKDNHLGLGRYAYERWVWSHPDVIPADVIPMMKINFTNFPQVWRPRLGRSLKGSPKRMALDRYVL
jgi:hypothetical protein